MVFLVLMGVFSRKDWGLVYLAVSGGVLNLEVVSSYKVVILFLKFCVDCVFFSLSVLLRKCFKFDF